MFSFGSTYTPLIDVYGVGVRLNSFLFIYMHALFSFLLFRLVFFGDVEYHVCTGHLG